MAGKFFQVYAKPNGRDESRLGITVNKRYVPRAVARNLCKRLARETFRRHRAALVGVDLVVRARAVVLAGDVRSKHAAEILELMTRSAAAMRRGRYRAKNRASQFNAPN